MSANDYYKVWEIRFMEGKAKSQEAKKMLENIARLVQPIMRKHKWKVNLLAEFWDPYYLGLNHGNGELVEVKLRRTLSDGHVEFYPFDEVLDTMLHELCHNVYNDHDASFNNLWNQLRNEYRQQMVRPLGGNRHIMKAFSPVQAAVMAAQRRLHDYMWCASQSSGYEVAKNNVHEGKNVGSSRKRSLQAMDTPKIGSVMEQSKRRCHESESRSHSQESGMWECMICTLLNKSLSTICESCDTQRPKDVSTKCNTWSCKFCTLENNVKLEKCLACDQWRYSTNLGA